LCNSADKTVINFPLEISKEVFDKHEINEGHLVSWARYHFLAKEYKLGTVALKSVKKKGQQEIDSVKSTIRVVKKEMDVIKEILQNAKIPLTIEHLSEIKDDEFGPNDEIKLAKAMRDAKAKEEL
jgi:hypothetical protein